MIQNIENVGEMLFWIPVGVLLLAVMGLLWALPAALICTLVARLRKLDGGSYAVVGAKHSMLLILPWIYLLARLSFGRSLFPTSTVVSVYVLLYAVWFTFIAIDVIGLGLFVMDIFVIHSYSLGPTVFSVLLFSMILPINAYTWNRSVRNLFGRRAADKESARRPEVLHDEGYLEPFVWLIVWSLITVFMTLIAGLLGFVGT